MSLPIGCCLETFLRSLPEINPHDFFASETRDSYTILVLVHYLSGFSDDKGLGGRQVAAEESWFADAVGEQWIDWVYEDSS